MKTKIYNYLSQNSKMKKSTGLRTFNWGIPAYRSKDGFKTCPNAAACVIGCYAKSGAYLFSNVAKVFEARLAFSLTDTFVDVMSAEIQRRKVQRVRIHDSGDFYDFNYFMKWVEIMKRNPTVSFYAYTKMISMLKNLYIPDNFTLIFSFGGTEDKLIHVETERHSQVFESLELLQAAGYADASNDDNVALQSNHKIGLVYHGTKNYSNTNWDKVKKAA